MTAPPKHPKIYHITHVDNLGAIAASGGLVADAEMLRKGGPVQAIGMSSIKQRRIERLEVSCHPGTKVGDYVPFYFCPRSIMLYVIHCANQPELSYRGGQGPIVHLQADLQTVVRWATENEVYWAYSLSNAGAVYTEFRACLEDLDDLDWQAIDAADFRGPEVKEGKQAEFLVHDRLPFELVERIGVQSQAVRQRASVALAAGPYRPPIEVREDWYF